MTRSLRIPALVCTAALAACQPSPNPAASKAGSAGDGSGTAASSASGAAAEGSDAAAPALTARVAPATETRSDAIRRAVQAESQLDPFVAQGKVGDAIAKPGATRTESGIEYAVLQAGKGPKPPFGADIELHLTCWTRSGSALGPEFWNSRDDGVPHPYRLDRSDLIAGLVESIADMQLGERRWVIIPSALAYGERGYAGRVPAKVDIIVDVELASFRH